MASCPRIRLVLVCALAVAALAVSSGTLGQDQQSGFQQPVPPPPPAQEPQPEIAPTPELTMVPKIAVGLVDQDAGLEQSDVEYLRQAILTALNELAAGRYEAYLATFFPGPCDTSCQSAVVQQSGGAYYVTGEVRRFAGSYIVSLWLLRPNGGPAAPRVESKPLASAAELLEGTKELVGELMDGGPFRSTAVVQPAPDPVQPAPAPQPAGDPWSLAEPEMYSEERSHIGLRISTYLVLGVGGILTSIGGVILAAELAEGKMPNEALSAGVALVIIGPSLAVASLIMGSVYYKRTKDDERSHGPTALVAPRFAGLGYVAWF
jgi:hypothetical protein